MKHPVLWHIRRSLTRGLILVLPLLITVWLLSLLFRLLNENITPYIRGALEYIGMPGLERSFATLGIPVIGLMLTISFVYLLGLFAGNLAGRRVVSLLESYILKIPVVKAIYGAARQLLDAFSMTGSGTFSRVVIIEYPRHGLWTLGFVTREGSHKLPTGGEPAEVVPVFLPTTPNPTSGWMILVPSKELWVLDMSIEDGMKLVVSGGLVSPADLGERIVTHAGSDGG